VIVVDPNRRASRRELRRLSTPRERFSDGCMGCAEVARRLELERNAQRGRRSR
jgi:hypothetical protein